MLPESLQKKHKIQDCIIGNFRKSHPLRVLSVGISDNPKLFWFAPPEISESLL